MTLIHAGYGRILNDEVHQRKMKKKGRLKDSGDLDGLERVEMNDKYNLNNAAVDISFDTAVSKKIEEISENNLIYKLESILRNEFFDCYSYKARHRGNYNWKPLQCSSSGIGKLISLDF